MFNDSFCDHSDSQAHTRDLSCQDWQYAPTPGYYDHTPPSEYGFSPSPDCYTQDGPAAPSSPQEDNPRLLQLCEWEECRTDDELPQTSEDTEQDVTLTPSAHWPSVLKGKLEKVLQERVSRNRRVRSDDTSIVVSVNDRKQRDLKKRFNSLDIDWMAVEKQLLAWSKLYTRGKELRLVIVFHYIEDDLSRSDKRGKSPVTKKMLNERDAQLDAEDLMGYPSPSCHLGPHCWQDPHGKKHYQLRTHHLKRLIAYVEGGGVLECQDDVPDTIREELYMEEQHRLESSRSKSNKGAVSGSCPPININFMGAQPSMQPAVITPTAASVLPPLKNRQDANQLVIYGPRDVAVREYSAWQETNVIDETLKAQFRLACDVTLTNGLDLEQIHEDHNAGFFIEKGVAVGIARRANAWQTF
ncbi:hypothetical protein N7447_005347 [Penicillium robsamsonii]|uniref:uncharacterized protein n=1 Tax=Penicillium robsamsonii TaxID=1792511 RepID=UPI002548A2FD|nr:uncharacterized protein N7447_005347 [Penicillium robsamsonii]KAJ5823007.1 hypothetical protein N7447_005347 [Penicillium robsamsonii]